MVASAGASLAMTLIKICGLRQLEQAAAIAAMGVDAIGVIAVPASPRFVPQPKRPALFEAAMAANPRCRGVLVVADPGDGELEALQAGQGHRVVQLHGSESPQRCRQLRNALPGVELWKALRVRERADLEQISTYADLVDAVLLDAWVPGVLGGTGQGIPLDWLFGFEAPLPWWLAGGIAAGTAAAALSQLQPTGLDASSALEHSPGDKDLARVHDLVAVVKAPRQDQGH